MPHDKNYPASRGFVDNGDGTFSKPKSKKALVVAPEKISVTALSLWNQVSDEESNLNKTEKARLAYLRMLNMPNLMIQAITLKLAFDCRLTADFSYMDENGVMTLEDVKGFQREDALIKMKVAARKFPMFRFLIVKKDGASWDIQQVKA